MYMWRGVGGGRVARGTLTHLQTCSLTAMARAGRLRLRPRLSELKVVACSALHGEWNLRIALHIRWAFCVHRLLGRCATDWIGLGGAALPLGGGGGSMLLGTHYNALPDKSLVHGGSLGACVARGPRPIVGLYRDRRLRYDTTSPFSHSVSWRGGLALQPDCVEPIAW